MKIIVAGGGICGLATAMMLARDGAEVTVLERDEHEPPASVHDAVERWERSGVAQFKQAHFVHARVRHTLQDELPGVVESLLEHGAKRFDPLKALLPPAIDDRAPREEDDKFWTATGRRPFLELVIARLAEETRNVSVLRGKHITGVVTGTEVIDGVPHVTGVRFADGTTLEADLVIDAMGRRSDTPQWIVDAGGKPPYEEAEDCGYIYFARHFRATNGSPPEPRTPLLWPLGTVSALTLPADNDTWTLGLVTASRDKPLKELRFEDKWRKVIAACPDHAHWLDGEPIEDFMVMAGIMDRIRRFVVDGEPVVTGLLPVADAWACTNPSFGRGISLGISHAARLSHLVRGTDGDYAQLARAWDADTEAELTPWYRAQVELDRARVAEMEALRAGADPYATEDPVAAMRRRFFIAAARDADIFRGLLEVIACLATPQEVLSRPGNLEKMLKASEEAPAPPAGPSREKLLSLLA